MATKMQARRPMRKTPRNVSTLTVVSNGVRKARSIKKFQDSYYVGLAYVGLVELQLSRDEPGWRGDGKKTHRRSWRANTVADTPYGVKVFVNVLVEGHQSVWDDPRWAGGDFSDAVIDEYGGGFNYTQIQRENMAGITENTFTFDLSYSIEDETKGGNSKSVFSKRDVGTYYSIEDCLDAMTQMSEEAWGDVTIALGEYQDALEQYHSVEDAFPETIALRLPNGESITLEKREEGNWFAEGIITDPSAITMNYEVAIKAVVLKNGEYNERDLSSRWYGTDRYATVGYYAVEVTGTIADNNTQIHSSRSYSEAPDTWKREFTGEGAETLEGAIAIAESNLAEVYQEQQDYIASERNYEKFSNGQGYRNTTLNTNEWNYNFGDSNEDEKYMWFQEEDYESLADEEWDDDEGYSAFEEEYFGSNRWYIAGSQSVYNSRGYTIGQTYYPSKYGDNEKVQAFMQNHTREDVERVCAMTNCTLTEYTDPLNFTITVNRRIKLSTKKSVRKSKPAHIYYDVEMRRMKSMCKSKQAQPKSFNSMVKSIRAKNNKKRSI